MRGKHLLRCGRTLKLSIEDLIKWVEDTLTRDGTFPLPGRKAPLGVILVDAMESPIEHPKKAKAILFRKEKSGTH